MAYKKTTITGDLQVNGKVDAIEGATNSLLASLRTLVETSIGTAYTTNGDVLAIIQTLADMASDSKLTPVEKKEVKRVWDGIEAEKPIITTQATNAGILVTDAPYVDYEAAYAALYDYLFGVGGVLLDLTTTSDIVGTVFRQKFEDYIYARQNLQSAIQDKQPTYTEVLTGFTEGGGTLTPTPPVLAGSCLFTTAYLTWNKQTDLTGVITHNIYRATSFAGTYSLIANTPDYEFQDANLTLDTDIDGEPILTNYYYRVTRLVNGGSESSVSNTATITAIPIPEGNIAAGSITAAKIQTGVLNALIAQIAASLVISNTYGFVAGPEADSGLSDGDIRTFLDQDEIKIQEWRSGTWYDLIALTVTGAPGYRESEITAWAYSGVFRRGIKITKNYIAWINTDGTEIAKINRESPNTSIINFIGQFNTPVSLPFNAEKSIYAASVLYPSLIKIANGNILCSYRKSSTGYIVLRISTDNGVTWGSEIPIKNEDCNDTCLMQHSNGNIYCAYRHNTSTNIRYAISTDNGLTWDSDLHSVYLNASWPSLIQLVNGNLICALRTSTDDTILLTSIDNGLNWITTSTVSLDTTYNCCLLQITNGDIICSYINNTSGNILVIKKSTNNGETWGSEITINTGQNLTPFLMQKSNGDLVCIYKNITTGTIALKISTNNGSTWGSEIIVNSTGNAYPKIIQLNDGNLFCIYIQVTTLYLVSRLLEYYAQIGAGIIESGSNTYGYYQYFSDGTLVQWGDSGAFTPTWTLVAAPMYVYLKSITFPKSFIDLNYSYNDRPRVASNVGLNTGQAAARAVNGLDTYIWRVNGSTQFPISIEWKAIGRWK